MIVVVCNEVWSPGVGGAIYGSNVTAASGKFPSGLGNPLILSPKIQYGCAPSAGDWETFRRRAPTWRFLPRRVFDFVDQYRQVRRRPTTSARRAAPREIEQPMWRQLALENVNAKALQPIEQATPNGRPTGVPTTPSTSTSWASSRAARAEAAARPKISSAAGRLPCPSCRENGAVGPAEPVFVGTTPIGRACSTRDEVRMVPLASTRIYRSPASFLTGAPNKSVSTDK